MSALRAVSVWIVAFALAVALAALFATLTVYQLTSEDTGERILRRSIAATTDIDAALPRIEADLDRLTTGDSPETATVPNFPIQAELTREEATTLRGGELRDVILDRAAHKLYTVGGDAWTEGDPQANRNIERVSTTGAIDYGLGFVRDSTNAVFLVLAVILAVVAIGMTAVLLVVLPWDMRLLGAGSVAVVAGLPGLAAAVAVRFVFRTADDEGDPFVKAMLDLGVDSMWVPIRNFAVLSLFGFLLIIIATTLLWWGARHRPAGSPALDTQS
ncbi:MAG: hypothetical protein WD904_04275 [Dehalococcoidia bacterium]